MKGFEELWNDILTDYRNQFPNMDTSQGSLLSIRSACLASALWGCYRYQEWVARQRFAHTADTPEHHAWVRGIERQVGESDASLLARYLADLRDPPAGGNKDDYEVWAKDVSIPAATEDTPGSTELSSSGMGSFNAAQAVDANTATKAWDTDAASAGAFVSHDAGVGCGQQYVKLRLFMDGAGCAAAYSIGYSDNGADWTVAATLTPSAAGWNEVEWNSVGVHRYWRLYLTNTPGAGPDVYEMEWYGGAESVSDAHCIPIARGVGTVDTLVVGSLGNGLPSKTLVAAVQAEIESKRCVTAKDHLALAPAITEQAVTMTVYGVDADLVTIESECTAYINELAFEDDDDNRVPLYLSQFVAIAIANGATNAVVTHPTTDITPSAYEVLRAGTMIITAG